MEENELLLKKSLFDIYPISQQKHAFTAPDFRFRCLLPNPSYDAKMCMLNADYNEAFLLYNPDNQEVVGNQYKDGKVLSHYPDIQIHDIWLIHFALTFKRVEGHIITTTFDYAFENGLLDGYFELVCMLAKCEVKFGYKQIKKDIFNDGQIVLPIAEEKNALHLPAHIYEINREEFLRKKINEDLSKHPHAHEVLTTLQSLFFVKPDLEGEFLRECLAVGRSLIEHAPLQATYQEN